MRNGFTRRFVSARCLSQCRLWAESSAEMEGIMKKFLAMMTAVVLCMTALAACCSDETSANAGSQTGDRPVLVVVTNAEFPPFEYVGDDGEPDGFDVALIKAVADKMGMDVQMENMEFGSLVSSIGTKIDAAIAGMSITEERLLEVDFSDEYYEAVQYIVVPAGSDIQAAADLEGKTIGVQLGTTGANIADEVSGADVKTYNKALEVLGAVDTAVFGRLFRLVQDADVTGCIGLLEEIVVQGRELSQFVSDFTWYLRNLLLVQSSEDIEDVIDVSSENLEKLKEEANLADMEAIVRYIHIFSELSNRIRYASQKRILIEVALIKLCRPRMETSQEGLLGRVRELERRLESGIVTVAAQGGPVSAADAVKASEPVKEALPKAIPEDVKRVVERWNSIVTDMEQPMKTYLKGARLSLGGENRLLVVVEDGIASDYLKNPENKAHLQQMIAASVQKEIEIEIQSVNSGQDKEDAYIDLTQIINMEIEEEE